MGARTTAGFVLVAAVTALTGCQAAGGTTDEVDPPTTSSAAASPEDAVTEVLQGAYTTADPASCTERYTERALAQAYRGAPDPLAACEEQEASPAAAEAAGTASIDVADLVVDGDRATVTVTPQGAASGGTVAYDLVLVEDGGWRIDEVVDVAVLDRAAYDDSVTAVVEQVGPTLMAPDDVACVDQQLRAVPDEALARSVVEGASSTSLLADAVRACLGGGTDLVAILQLSTYQLEQGGLSTEKATCVAGLAITGYGELTLEGIIADPAVKDTWMQALSDAATDGLDSPAGALCATA